MCGIIGYIGQAEATPILMDGLRRLEYRGYDSAGIALVSNGAMQIRKCAGRIGSLAQLIQKEPPRGSVGLGHTRWATHGAVTDENAHPHVDQSGKLALIHNGVIENFQPLRDQLLTQGHQFRTETDTEVLTHLVGHLFDQLPGPRSKETLLEALRQALKQVNGTYGLALVHLEVPDVVLAARRGSPLVLGIGKGQNFIVSDVSAIVGHTRDVVYLDDYDLVTIERDHFDIASLAGTDAKFQVSKVEFTSEDADKGVHPHYMLKEIFEQPNAIRDAMRGRLSQEDSTAKLGGLNMSSRELREVERIVLTACGSAFHTALVGEYLLENLAHIPTECEFASEFRYRNMPMNKDTLVFAISQSGETIDTLAALRESKRKGHRTLGICNNVGSTIARESDGGVYMHAGPEIGVAATKSFTSQLVCLTLLALLLGRIRHLSSAQGIEVIQALERLPDQARQIVAEAEVVRELAIKYADSAGFLFFGRQHNYPIALEGALKLKEISYRFAEGHPSAELKHGVIALVRPEVPSILIAPDDPVLEKNINALEQIKARKGKVIAVATEGRKEIARLADDVMFIPKCPDYISPVLSVIPLQLFAYYLAVHLGCDVDKPRNLAKSVTVE
ncbi:MAG: glutamine--fructose-6-phosphate transaminase (isomerizing) [Verrucomicrobia bacterium]|nr:glutamine--fructose-6-phosphate transaminase (isomerizing) [Verrucomicrobiota bacterium]MBV9274079.1 glutamine--fructose-6-phosphate transaminase (isomerizing) [Verrucomicrobiota bacterium]